MVGGRAKLKEAVGARAAIACSITLLGASLPGPRPGAKPNPFIDPAGYRAHIDHTEAAFLKDLRQQQEKAAQRAGGSGR